MKRHEMPFPIKEGWFYQILLQMWEQGWLDDFAEEHFLIRGLKNDNRIRNNFISYYRQCTFQFGLDQSNFAMTFCANLSSRIALLIEVFGERTIKEFVKGQLAAGKKHYKEEQFFEALSEIEILTYFCQFGPGRVEGTYEPRIGMGNHNPEASFTYSSGIRIDVEVKTPEFTNIYQSQDVFMPLYCLSEEGIDAFERECKKRRVVFQRPRVSKLKSFLNSACKKFAVPINDKHYNILFVNWTYTEIPYQGYIEPVALLSNPYNGIMNHAWMAKMVDVDEDIYSKITAVIVFQNPSEAVVFQDLRYLLASRTAGIVINPFILDTEEKINEFYSALQIHPQSFEMEEIPEIYYNIERYHTLYFSGVLSSIVNKYMIQSEDSESSV